MQRIYAITFSSLFFLFAATVHADEPFRCGSHIVEVGDDRETVLENCGQPTTEEGWVWTYDRGPEEFKVHVHFGPDGSVNEIEEDDTF